MEVITIESRAFKQIMEKLEKLEALSDYVYSLDRSAEEDDNALVDSQEVCHYLGISERTLQRLRTNKKITYTCLVGKYYYKISQIKKLLDEHVIKSTDDCLQNLIECHKQRQAKKK